jgi:type I restriction-modification system DNA methylase subunit
MSDEEKKQLEQQLWNIANTLRGKIDADSDIAKYCDELSIATPF